MMNYPFNTSQHPMVWLDVGAHLGEKTRYQAQHNPNLTVYAFEPNPSLVAQLFGMLPNFIIIPAAVALQDSVELFYFNALDATSSLKPFNPERLEQWIGGEQLEITTRSPVPTLRLDTFLNRLGIEQVDYLKIDAQGSDFDVIQSLGDRLPTVAMIQLEVAITPTQLYEGAADKGTIVDYLTTRGFVLVSTEKQSAGQEENLSFIQNRYLATWLGPEVDIKELGPEQLGQLTSPILAAISPIPSQSSALLPLQPTLAEVKAECQQWQHTYQTCQGELEAVQRQLASYQMELARSQAHTLALEQRISAMESSKFWQIRRQWMRVKQQLGLATDRD